MICEHFKKHSIFCVLCLYKNTPHPPPKKEVGVKSRRNPQIMGPKIDTECIVSFDLWGFCNFSCFCCPLLTFFSKLTFSKNSLGNTISVSKSLDPDFLLS